MAWRRFLFGRRATARDDPPDGVDFRMLTENSNDVIVQCDAGGRTLYASPSVRTLLGVDPETVVARGHLAFVLPEHMPEIRETIARYRAGAREAISTVRMRRGDGRIIWVEANGRVIGPGQGGGTGRVVIMRDVTERKRLEEQLAALAMTDGLTGLANRRAFDEALEREWRRTAREGTHALSLLLLDVDHFKGFNDLYGHQAGDDCLRSVAGALQRSLWRAGDLASRYGGEEMAAILPTTNAAGAVEIGDRIRATVEALGIPHEGNPGTRGIVTISVGAATAISGLDGSVAMPVGLLQAADAALYRAKRGGRNRCEHGLVLQAAPARVAQATA